MNWGNVPAINISYWLLNWTVQYFMSPWWRIISLVCHENCRQWLIVSLEKYKACQILSWFWWNNPAWSSGVSITKHLLVNLKLRHTSVLGSHLYWLTRVVSQIKTLAGQKTILMFVSCIMLWYWPTSQLTKKKIVLKHFAALSNENIISFYIQNILFLKCLKHIFSGLCEH